MPTVRLALLANPTLFQRSVLGAFRYSRNDTWLHTDATLLPVARRARASWNFLLPSCVGPTSQALVSYDMNRLQGIPSTRPHIVTLNATDRIDPERVLARMTYEHPISTTASLEAQRHLSSSMAPGSPLPVHITAGVFTRMAVDRGSRRLNLLA